MKKYLLFAITAFTLLASQAFAANSTVPGTSLVSIWNAGVLQGFAISGISGTTNSVPVFNNNGGQTIGAAYAGVTPPANGLIVQGNVGIGSNSPSVPLDVVGAAHISGAVTAAGVSSSDSITMTAAAKGLVLKQGANGRTGTFTCNGTTPVDVANTSLTTSDIIVFSLKTVGGTVGVVSPTISLPPNGTKFTVVCQALDTSVYGYAAIGSAP